MYRLLRTMIGGLAQEGERPIKICGDEEAATEWIAEKSI